MGSRTNEVLQNVNNLGCGVQMEWVKNPAPFFWENTLKKSLRDKVRGKWHISEHKKKPEPIAVADFFAGRSGETRTLGLMLPKHARYQLRHTPIS